MRVVSFFSGCGGMDLGVRGGFEYRGLWVPETGLKIVAAYESNDLACRTYRDNVGDEIVQMDLTTADYASMPSADILIGGFPCQDFSTIGCKAGLDGARGPLYQCMLGYLQAHRPKIVVGENVFGLLCMCQGQWLWRIMHDVESCGYRAVVFNILSNDYGVPQFRRRIFIVGVRGDLFNFDDGNLFGDPVAAPKIDVGRTAYWAIGDIESLSVDLPNHNEVSRAKRCASVFGARDVQLNRDRPAVAIICNSAGYWHYSGTRRVSTREMARLQTFPDDFVWHHSMCENRRQIGNAVPPLLANVLIRHLILYLRGAEKRERGMV